MRNKYRFKIKQRPKSKDCWVQVLDGRKIIRVCKFTSCNAALSWLELAESYQA